MTSIKINLNRSGRIMLIREKLTDMSKRVSQGSYASYYTHKWTKSVRMYGMDDLEPPQEVFVMGNASVVLNSNLTVGFAGTLSPTYRGAEIAERLAQISAERANAVIVSGGVVGIDTYAHMGALDMNKATIAVTANTVESGLHSRFSRRSSLERQILNRGCLISEYGIDVPEISGQFRERLLMRDRIITALCDFFVVIESSDSSASVDAAKRAYWQGKQVMAVDWNHVDNGRHPPKRAGNDLLLKQKIAMPLRDTKELDMYSAFLRQLMPGSKVIL